MVPVQENSYNNEKKERSWNERHNQKLKGEEAASAAPAIMPASKPGAVPVSQRVDTTTNIRSWNEREHRKIANDLLKEHKRHIEKHLPRIVYTTTTMVQQPSRSTAVIDVVDSSMSSRNTNASTSSTSNSKTSSNSNRRNNNSDSSDRILLSGDNDKRDHDNDDENNNENKNRFGDVIPVVLDATVTSVVTLTTAHVVDEKEEQELAEKIKKLEETTIVEAIQMSDSDTTDARTKRPEGSCSKKQNIVQ